MSKHLQKPCVFGLEKSLSFTIIKRLYMTLFFTTKVCLLYAELIKLRNYKDAYHIQLQLQ